MPTCLLFPSLVETLMNRKLDHEQIVAFPEKVICIMVQKINMQIYLRHNAILDLF